MDVGVPEEVIPALSDAVDETESMALDTMLETAELSDRTDVGATTAIVDPAESVVRMLEGAEERAELSDPRALDKTLEIVELSLRIDVGATTATVLPNESVVKSVDETLEAVLVAVGLSVETAEIPIA